MHYLIGPKFIQKTKEQFQPEDGGILKVMKQRKCKEYIQATKEMERSYSKKAYPWDNACIESFHALLKREWLNRFKIVNYEHAYKLVFEYIETFYNTIRIHSHCGYVSPNNYEDIYKKQLTKMESMVA